MTKIDYGEITITAFTDDRIAEITINPAMKPVSAAMLVRAMTMSGITTAKIIRTTQTAKESPLSAVCDPTGERAVTS
jgi:hypothetical protein